MARSSREPGRRRPGGEAAADTEDAFLARVLTWSYWAKERVHVLVVLGIAVVLVGVGIFYYFDQRAAERQEAADTLEGIHALVEGGQQEQAYTELQGFVDRYSGLPEASEGRLLLGRLQLEEGDPEEARNTLEPLADDLDDPLGLDGAFLLGHAYEAQEQWGDAEALYLRLHEEAPLRFQRREALEAAARVRVEQNHYAGAVELYERVLELLDADDPRRGRIQMQLAEARARAEGS